MILYDVTNWVLLCFVAFLPVLGHIRGLSQIGGMSRVCICEYVTPSPEDRAWFKGESKPGRLAWTSSSGVLDEAVSRVKTTVLHDKCGTFYSGSCSA